MVQKTYTYELRILKTVFLFCFALFLACITDLTYGQRFNQDSLLDQLRDSGAFDASLAPAKAAAVPSRPGPPRIPPPKKRRPKW